MLAIGEERRTNGVAARDCCEMLVCSHAAPTQPQFAGAATAVEA
jgi:hypothetical protein